MSLENKENRRTVLFVDDEALVRRVGQRMLSRLGYSVLLAESGEEACKIYRNHKHNIDLVILDLSMPVMDGEDTFRKLHEMNNEIKVVISSGFDGGGRADNLLEKGVLDFVQKPFDLETLSNKLAHC